MKPGQPSGIVTLLTDFSTHDAYLAVMKGVMLGIARQLQFVDITHAIFPQDVTSAAYVLADAWRFFPAGTVHLVVVDPGVGSSRRAVAVAAGGHYFVAPDNGVLSLVLVDTPDVVAVELGDPAFWRTPHPSHTFHGRDIFAPAAAHLANGVPLEALGDLVTGLAALTMAEPEVGEDGAVIGQVVHVDGFGNLITNLLGTLFSEARWLTCAGRQIPIVTTYADVAVGDLCALVGSSGMIEVSVRNGSASQKLSVGRGEVVRA